LNVNKKINDNVNKEIKAAIEWFGKILSATTHSHTSRAALHTIHGIT
jgi:hypothetical protein